MEQSIPRITMTENNTLCFLNRSWWYLERDDGLLLTQFTNVLQAVRFDRNWTKRQRLSMQKVYHSIPYLGKSHSLKQEA